MRFRQPPIKKGMPFAERTPWAGMRPARAKPAALAAALAAVAALAFAPGASASWVIRGHGFGHGVGMSQWGAYGYAEHGRGYRWILGHYYANTHVGQASNERLRVLIGTVQRSLPFSSATSACGEDLRPARTYRFVRSRGGVVLKSADGKRLAGCGRSATARGGGEVTILGDRDYRGDMTVRVSGDQMLVINDVRLEAYVRGVVPNEMPSSWPADALRAQAVAARSFALTTKVGQGFDLYDDTRSQVYGGMDTETRRTNAAVKATRGQVIRYSGGIATAYFSSSSGGRTENVEFGFPGAAPQPYLKSVRDRYDSISPDHSWTVRYTQRQMESKLAGLFAGKLERIRVLKQGVSPRIVRAKVVGTRGSSRVSGPALEYRLDLKSTWFRARRR